MVPFRTNPETLPASPGRMLYKPPVNGWGCNLILFEVVLVALIQGLGEVLPLGGAGHLAALSALGGTPEGRAAISVAAHVGTVAALMLYFWRDMFAMGLGLWKMFKGRPDSGSYLLLHVVAGTLPALAVAWLFLNVGGSLGSRLTAASAMVVFGLFLLVSDKVGMTVRRIEHMSWPAAISMGVLQAAALIPGVSRTGITITAARLMGYEREAAVRFSLLLGLPLFAAHAIHTFWKLSRQAEVILSPDLGLAALASGLASLLAVALMMAWVRRHDFTPFAAWRILFGLAMVATIVWRAG
jgi:undecaprenyl-diphosphatase